jgi:hypothetical protein
MGIDINPVEITDISNNELSDDIEEQPISNNICNKIKSLINPNDIGIEYVCKTVKSMMSMSSSEESILRDQLTEYSPNGIHFITNNVKHINEPV